MMIFSPEEVFSSVGQRVVKVEYLPEKYRYIPKYHEKAVITENKKPNLSQLESGIIFRS